MTNSKSPEGIPEQAGVSRRTVVKGAAWAVPVVAVATAVPMAAASGALTVELSIPGACVDAGAPLPDAVITVRDDSGAVSGATVTLTFASSDGGVISIDGTDYPTGQSVLVLPTGVYTLSGATAVTPGTVVVTASAQTEDGRTATSEPQPYSVCTSNVFAWGHNAEGQTGGGSSGTTLSPVAWKTSTKFTAIAGSWSSIAAIATNGEVYTSGANGAGSFGNGSFAGSTPDKPAGPAKIATAKGEFDASTAPVFHADSFAGSFGHFDTNFFAWGTDGALYATGENASDYFSRDDGTGDGQADAASAYTGYVPIGLKILEANPGASIVKIAVSGWWRNAYLLDDGTVWNAGSNERSAFGDNSTPQGAQNIATQTVKQDGSPLTGIKDVALTQDAALYLDESGNLWGAGDNGWGQLPGVTGNGASRPYATPITQPDGKSVAKIVASASDADSFAVMTTDGAWYAVGRNLNGQMGVGHTNSIANVWTPILVPAGKTVSKLVFGNDGALLLATDGTVWFAGSNDAGGRGDGTASGSSGNWSQVPLSGPATDVAATWWDTYAAVV